MPRYDIRCTNEDCEEFNKELDVWVPKVTDEVLCPICDEIAQKIIGTPGFAFKGPKDFSNS